MTYRIRIGSRAQAEIDEFAAHAVEYGDQWALGQIARLEHAFSIDLAEYPLQRTFFFLTGAPYRGYLFRVGRRTHYWIVYAVDEAAQVVDVLRFWNTHQDASQFRVPGARDQEER